MSGQLYLRLCGLAPVHDEARIRQALIAVFKHNLKTEEGLLNGSDPRGRDDWRWFARYSDRGDDEALSGQWVTPWTGTEYYVAATMMTEGLAEQALAVARNVYDRHAAAGMHLNHIECGEHYFRAAAAWILLPALQGLVFDASRAELSFAPEIHPENFNTLFILPGVWGRLIQQRTGSSQCNKIQVEAGEISLQTFRVKVPAVKAPGLQVSRIINGNTPVAINWQKEEDAVIINLDEKAVLRPGDIFCLNMQW